MNFLICISHVPDTTTKIQFTPDKKSLNKTGVTYIPNPYDEFGLSRALEFKEAGKGEKVTVITVGGPETEATLRRCLAVGADDAIRIDAEPMDAFQVASQIAAWAKDKDYQVIFTGKESIDFNGSQVPGMLAEMLGVSFVSFAIKFDSEGGKAQLEREVDGGSEVMESIFPVVISCQKGIAEWRIPNMRGIMAARSKPLTVIVPANVESKVITTTLDTPPAKSGCVYVANDNPEQLIQLLTEKGII